MQTRQKELFTAVRSEGALLPIEFIRRIDAFDKDVVGLTPVSYHLIEGETIQQRISTDWSRMQSAWQAFKAGKAKLTESDNGTSLTREKWLLPLFTILEYGRLDKAASYEIENKQYPISHARGNVPVHLVAFRIGLDKRSMGVAGASRSSPYSMVQEFLNRSEGNFWAFVSNGLVLRIIRNNVSLTRQAYIEFDLETMFENEIYSDFRILWILCHQSRFESDNPSECIMEQWVQQAREQGTRLLEDLRKGVEKSIALLGSGFVDNVANRGLREKLQNGTLDKQDYYRQLLRLVYRLIFLFAAEDRDILFRSDITPVKRHRYLSFYSTQRLRTLAGKMKGSVHGDLWQSLCIIMDILYKKGSEELGLSALGSMLWSDESTKDLTDCTLSNSNMLDAIRALAYTTHNGVRMAVDYRNMGTEELGSVYEALLELHPDINTETGKFELKSASGNERKTTGSYYTPSSLINCLLDSALEPVIKEAEKKPDPEKALLSLKICDAAAGSGHFLTAAAHRLAKRLAGIRTKEEEPPVEDVRHALRDVISRCIYGVDINPMAVELCKISLWMEAMEPGKPLTFIDHHIRCGNSLMGTTPALLAQGIPNDALIPIEGDDKKICAEYKKRNKKERGESSSTGHYEGGQISLLSQLSTPVVKLGNLTQSMVQLNDMNIECFEDIEKKQQYYEHFIKSQDYRFNHLLADTWCASFVIKKDGILPFPITEDTFRKIEENPFWVPPWLEGEISKLREQYQFFHWHLEFPDVFRVPGKGENAENQQCGWSGGFDCVLGNPPWEKIQTEEIQFFTTRAPQILQYAGNNRKEIIENLRNTDPALWTDWQAKKRLDASIIHFIKQSGNFILTSVGKFNYYALFAEKMYQIYKEKGTVGCIVPSGIATDDTTKYYFQKLIVDKRLLILYDFENRNGIFESVHRSFKFCLLVLGGKNSMPPQGAQFIFYALTNSDLLDKKRQFNLTNIDISTINPNTHNCPTFRGIYDAELNKFIYARTKIFLKESNIDNSKQPRVWRLLNTTDDSSIFISGQNRIGYTIPVIEAKSLHQFDHRFATYNRMESSFENVKYEQKIDPFFESEYKNYVDDKAVRERLPPEICDRKWYLTFRNIARATDERTMISSIIPRGASCEVTPYVEVGTAVQASYYCGMFNSFIFDYLTRQKVGGTHISYFILYQIATVHFSDSSIPICFFTSRIAELSCTSYSLIDFANELGFGNVAFNWINERRFLIKCELDAAFFQLYLGNRDEWNNASSKDFLDFFPTPRHAINFTMETFPIIKRKEIAEYGFFKTKETILEIYDEMAEAIRTGKEYKTRLDPPPGDIRCTHGYKPRSYTPVNEKDEQSFPWIGLEYFIFKTIPHLVKALPGRVYWLYYNGALLLADPARCKHFILDEEVRLKYQNLTVGFDKVTGNLRNGEIRDNLRDDKFIAIDDNEVVTLVQPVDLIELEDNVKAMIPFGAIALETLEQRLNEKSATRSDFNIEKEINEIIHEMAFL